MAMQKKAKVYNVIGKMKASGSPCPLDQISVIAFKRCSYLRTYMTNIIQSLWSSGEVPSEWKKAYTILVHKKGDTADPANFRLITLESVPLKIFTSCLRNSLYIYIYIFLLENNYIESKIQKVLLQRFLAPLNIRLKWQMLSTRLVLSKDH